MRSGGGTTPTKFSIRHFPYKTLIGSITYHTHLRNLCTKQPTIRREQKCKRGSTTMRCEKWNKKAKKCGKRKEKMQADFALVFAGRISFITDKKSEVKIRRNMPMRILQKESRGKEVASGECVHVRFVVVTVPPLVKVVAPLSSIFRFFVCNK